MDFIEDDLQQANEAQVEISRISKDSADNIESVAGSAAEITTAMDEIAGLGEQDKELGERLDDAVKQFKV